MIKIHFGQEIKKIMIMRNVRAEEIAQALHLHIHSVYDMLKRENIDVYRLMELSEILQYDFFQDIRISSNSENNWCNISINGDKIIIERKNISTTSQKKETSSE